MGRLTECQNCGKQYDINDLDPVDHLWERVDAGEPMPAGQCPDEECQAICHLVKQGDTGMQGDTPAPREWLYRVMFVEELGDEHGELPDWGAVRAADLNQLRQRLTRRFSEIWGQTEVEVEVYEIGDWSTEGFPETGAGITLTLYAEDIDA